MSPIQPHRFSPDAGLGHFHDDHTYSVLCGICHLEKRMCELTYKPREDNPWSAANTIAPHKFNCTLTSLADAHGYEPRCLTCGFLQHECERRYDPDTSRFPRNPVCQRFVGKREWGIGPSEPWRLCQECGWSKAQHELPSCTGVLVIAGKDFRCELNSPHQGWGHSNQEAQAIWQ